MGLVKGIKIIKSINYEVLKPSQGDSFTKEVFDKLWFIYNNNDKEYIKNIFKNLIFESILEYVIILCIPLITVLISINMLSLFCKMFNHLINVTDCIFLYFIVMCVFGFIVILTIIIYKCILIKLIRLSIMLHLLKPIYNMQKNEVYFKKVDTFEITKKIENLLIEWDTYD